MPHRPLRSDQRGTVAVIFAMLLVPLTMVVALAIDYGFFIQARAQLNLAADAASLYAVRVASQAYTAGYSTTAAEAAAGQLAGQQWFAAQLGRLAEATNATPTVSVTYMSAPSNFTSQVSYTASIPTNFGVLLPASLPISGSSSSTVQTGYVEVIMLVDNSSSMLIGATTADMLAMEQATPCSTQAASFDFPMLDFSWNFPSGYGYSTWIYGSASEHLTRPTASPVRGACDSGYDGPASLCFYPPSLPTISASSGLCSNGGGAGPNDYYGQPQYAPQAPCAFACHSSSSNNDYYALARSLSPAVTLRIDLVHAAAKSVVQSLINNQQVANQFSVGYYEFNSDTTKVYPTGGSAEAGTGLSAALTAINTLDPPLSNGMPSTDFATSMSTLAGEVTAAGNGLAPATPSKNLFIVTDGLSDTVVNGSQVVGPFTNAANETLCQPFKTMGFTIYVLYTTYLPIPTATYIAQVKSQIEPSGSSAVETALQACASNANTYFQATDSASITAAMQSMLKSALSSAGRVSN